VETRGGGEGSDVVATETPEEGMEKLMGGSQPCVPEYMKGGNFQDGQTANLELDDILTRYLPAHLLLPCDTVPTMSYVDAKHITARVKREKLLYFPLYSTKH
jgi:hypothetical protein